MKILVTILKRMGHLVHMLNRLFYTSIDRDLMEKKLIKLSAAMPQPAQKSKEWFTGIDGTMLTASTLHGKRLIQ